MSSAITPESNELLISQLTSDSEAQRKNANEALNAFTRMKMREDGFRPTILPDIPVQNSDLDRAVDTDKNHIVVDMEPGSPAAISIPYGTLPESQYIMGRKYRIMFDRIASPRFQKDKSELRTYHIDLRQVLSDNAIRDMLAEEDGKLIRATNTVLVGVGQTVPATGSIQWVAQAGGISRINWAESQKIMPRTPARLDPAVLLINNVTVHDLEKWGRGELGGDLAQEVAINGWAERQIGGKRLRVTIKRDLVPDGTVFQYAEPKALGKFCVLEDTVMAVEKRFFMFEFFAYKECGGSIGNHAAVARIDFQGLITASY